MFAISHEFHVFRRDVDENVSDFDETFKFQENVEGGKREHVHKDKQFTMLCITQGKTEHKVHKDTKSVPGDLM